MIDTQIISKLREQTGAGVMDVKQALQESNNNEAKALEILKQKGAEIAAKKQAERETKDGVVDVYIHSNAKSGAVVVLSCETDFVAKNEEFRKLAHDIAMHVTAMNPESIEQLLEQSSIQDGEKTISQLINEATAKLGEKIEIKEIKRFSV